MRLSPLEDSKQIRIDEIRELIADLALKSHQVATRSRSSNPPKR